MNKDRLLSPALLIKILTVTLLIIAGSVAFHVCAINTARGGLKPLNMSHGLSDLLVNVIYKDSAGYVWLGTESSIDRFDGNQILRFPIPGTTHKSKRVLSVAESGDKIFVGTNQGLFSLTKGELELIPLKPDKLDLAINSICAGDDKRLFIGTAKGLYIYNEKTGQLTHKLLADDALSVSNDVKAIWQEDKNSLWLLTPHRIREIQLSDFTNFVYKLPVNSVATSLCAFNGIIYIGTDGEGVIPFDIKNLLFSEPIKVGNNIVTSLSATPEHELLIGTDGEGIYVYSVAERRITDHLTASIDSKMQLRSNSVYSTLKDRDGLLWVGYYQSGVDYTPKPEYEPEVVSLGDEFSLGRHLVRSFDKKDNYIAVGTHDGLFLINETTGETKRYSTPELSSNMILAVKYWNGDFYIGTYHGGIYRLNPQTGILSPFGPQASRAQSVFCMEIGPHGSLWVATSEGVYKFGDTAGEPELTINSQNSQLPDGNVYDVFFDSLGRGWLSTENGIGIWNGKYVQTSGFPAGFVDKMKIRIVYEDKDHNLYFAPDRGDMWQSDLSLQNFQQMHQSAESRFSQIVSVIEDRDGWIWIGTDKGLVRFNKKDTKQFMIFNHVGDEINPIYTLAQPYMDANQNIWFGTTNGIHKVNLEELKSLEDKNTSVPLIISNVESGGKSLLNSLKGENGEYELKLNENQRDVQFSVTDLKFRYLDNIEMEYIMEGIDSGWKWTEGKAPISYHDLAPGSYMLKIREAGNPASTVTIKIKKSRKFPWWWIAGGCLLILLSISTYYYYKHKQELQKLKEQKPEKSSKEISDTADDKKETAESGHKPEPYRTTRLSDEECKRLIRKLDSVMKTEKPFINPDLKIKDLAVMIDTNAHSLSFLFNQYLDKSYYDYVNEWRVAEFKELVKLPESSKYTLTTMAEKCGFSSRASFFRHFKSLTGMTPSEYLKKVGK